VGQVNGQSARSKTWGNSAIFGDEVPTVGQILAEPRVRAYPEAYVPRVFAVEVQLVRVLPAPGVLQAHLRFAHSFRRRAAEEGRMEVLLRMHVTNPRQRLEHDCESAALIC